MSRADEVVIAGSARTPIGGFQGELAAKSAAELGAVAIEAAIERAGVDPARIDEVLMGNVLGAGQGQAPARQAALDAGLPEAVPCTTLNKMCGSGMKAVMQAYDAILAGSARTVVAGGMESMSNAPYLLPKARAGLRLGHGEVKDHLFLDGLEDAYAGRLMGTFADDTARALQIDRQAQDAYAIASLERAQAAATNGAFMAEVVPVAVLDRREERLVDTDEQPRRAQPDKIPALKPAFSPDGTVTPANASSISDGAAALVVAAATEAHRLGLDPQARIVATATHARAPAWFTTAPIQAIADVLAKAEWAPDEVELFEINEAFAVVVLAAMRDLGLGHDRVNVNGGACALGHPIGASGARILVTLIHAMQARGARRGVAALCIGGGEATAVAIERV